MQTNKLKETLLMQFTSKSSLNKEKAIFNLRVFFHDIGSRYSRMDQVRFVEESLKKFTWSILEYLDPYDSGKNGLREKTGKSSRFGIEMGKLLTKIIQCEQRCWL